MMGGLSGQTLRREAVSVSMLLRRTGSGPIASSYSRTVVSDDQIVDLDRPAARLGMFRPQ